MATRKEKPRCLLVCSADRKGVNAQSFIQSYTLTTSAFNVFLATPGGASIKFVGVDDKNRQWVTDFYSKAVSPEKLEEIDEFKFAAMVIPSATGAVFDLASNQHLGTILNSFVREKKPICAVGYGVTGLFSALDIHTKQWAFQDFTMTAPSLAEIAKHKDFFYFPFVPSEFIRNHKSTYSASRQDHLYVVVDDNLVTGQNEKSTLTAVQNLILLSNAHLIRGRQS